MADELILYTNPMSRGIIAHWMLEEVGVPYETELLSLDLNEHKRPEYLKINPMGKVPTIVHRGVVVTEAAAICTYLADAFPETKLAPTLQDRDRGSYLRWLFFGPGCIEPALSDKSFPRVTPTTSRQVAWGSYDDTFRVLEAQLQKGPYILGERFSAADVYIGAAVDWGLFSKGLDARPTFTSYVERLKARPAYKRMSEQCGKLIEQLKARGNQTSAHA